MNELFEIEKKVPAQNHGYEFKNMYENEDDNVISLANKVIESVLFDDDGFFAGFRLKNVMTGVYKTLSPL